MDPEQMESRCGDENFDVVSPSYIEGFSLTFDLFNQERKGGVADLVESNENTWGVLYKITEQALSELDRYEGYDEKRPIEQNKYIRKKVDIKNRNGTKVEAYCYFVNKKEEFVPPSGEYLNIMINGARSNGLPDEAIKNIKIKGNFCKTK